MRLRGAPRDLDSARLRPGLVEVFVPADPVEVALARMEAAALSARARLLAGSTLDADPQDLRGIPVIARGVGGTSPGTDPARAVDRVCGASGGRGYTRFADQGQ